MSDAPHPVSARPPRLALLRVAALIAVAAIAAGCSKDDEQADATPAANADGNAGPVTAPPAAESRRTAVPADAQRAAPPTPAPSGDFQRTSIVDTGFGAPVTALTADVPAGWAARGGVRWNHEVACVTNSMRIEWSAASPDGTRAVEILPGFAWQVRGYEIQLNPCPVAPIGTVQDYLQALVAELYRGATIAGYRARPDLVAAAAASGGEPAQQPGFTRHREAGEIGIVYAINGREMRENIAAMVEFSELARPGARPSVMGTVSYAFVVRAPKGTEEDFGERVRASIRIDPQWQAQINEHGRRVVEARSAAQRADIDRWHQSRMAEISARGAADRSAIRSQTIREIGEINSAGWKSRQQSMDRMHRDNVDTIREVNRYQDPTQNRQVELSSHYNHGFRTNDGRYIATDNPNFNPGAGGQEMQRVR